MRQVRLNHEEQQVWNGITTKQKNSLLILVENYYEVNEIRGRFTISDLIFMKETETAGLLIPEQHQDFSSILPEQRLLLDNLFLRFRTLNEADLMCDYDDYPAYREQHYDVFVLYTMFNRQDNTFLKFKFLQQRN